MLDYESDDTISESSKNHDDQTTNAEEKTEVLHYNTPIRIDLSESSKPLKSNRKKKRSLSITAIKPTEKTPPKEPSINSTPRNRKLE